MINFLIKRHKSFLLTLFFLWMLPGCSGLTDNSNRLSQSFDKQTYNGVVPGAYRTNSYLPLIKEKRVGITGNQSSLIGKTHLVDSLLSLGIDIINVYCPEHGFRGEAEAGAVVKSDIDSITGLPVISLYGSKKKPTAEDLHGIDIMIFDIQDVGARFYTYISTLHYVMEACAEEGIPVIVLDRPNPHAHYVDGPVLNNQFSSFIGMHPVAIVHGMTIAEYAQMINEEGWLSNEIKCDLLLIPMLNYYRNTIYHLPVDPSPNLQDMHAIYLYPSVCLLEGTVVSVGRGTDFPFRLIGHPDVKNGDTAFVPRSIKGKSENPKFKGQKCFGWLLNGKDYNGGPLLDSIDLTILINMYAEIGGGEEFFRPSFNLLAGNDLLKKQIISKESEQKIRKSWQEDLDNFKQIREKYLLYSFKK